MVPQAKMNQYLLGKLNLLGRTNPHHHALRRKRLKGFRNTRIKHILGIANIAIARPIMGHNIRHLIIRKRPPTTPET